MDDIIVVDDFLNQEELTHMGSISSYKDDHWQIHNSGKNVDVFDFYIPFISKQLNDNEYYTSYLFNKIKKTFNYNFKLEKVYLNGHEPLRHGSFHIDNDADRTVILYITPWEPAWGGFTQFMISEKDHVNAAKSIPFLLSKVSPISITVVIPSFSRVGKNTSL